MRFVYIVVVSIACVQIPYFTGMFISEWWDPALPVSMFFGGMIYKAYLQYDKKENPHG